MHQSGSVSACEAAYCEQGRCRYDVCLSYKDCAAFGSQSARNPEEVAAVVPGVRLAQQRWTGMRPPHRCISVDRRAMKFKASAGASIVMLTGVLVLGACGSSGSPSSSNSSSAPTGTSTSTAGTGNYHPVSDYAGYVGGSGKAD